MSTTSAKPAARLLGPHFWIVRGLIQVVDSLESWFQPGIVRHLDCKSGPGVQFEHHRTMFSIQHNVDSQVAKWNEICDPSGHE